MPTKQEKEMVVRELKEKLSASKVAILADYRGLDVAAITKVRRRLRESGSELKVAKNTLTRLAARDIGLEELGPYLQGPTAIVFGFQDVVAPAKILVEMARDYKQIEVKGGILEGRLVKSDEIKRLAELPSREVLLSKVAGSMRGPLYALVNTLQGNIRNLAYVLNAIYEKKSGEAKA